jgi:mycofactocin system glycosyltransferase
VQLDPGLRRFNDGRVLLGGNPIRLLKLSAPAADLLANGSRLRVSDDTTAALARRLLDAGAAHPRPSAATSQADVTVVVPVRDRPHGLERLLAAIGRTAGVLPVVVVDDGSRDALAVRRICARYGATAVRHDLPRGPSAARNRGLAAAATPYVAFLDSDSEPVTGWLHLLQQHLEDPLVAAAAPRIVALGTRTSSWLASYEAAVSSLDLGPREGPVHPHGGIPYVPGVALLVRRAALAQGYDETMHVAEDVDLVWRLVAGGWRVRYEPTALVAHDHPTSVAAWARRRAFYGTGAADLAARHGSAVAPIVMSAWSAAAWLALLAGHRRGPVCTAAILAWATARLTGRLTDLTDVPDLGLRWPLAARLVGLGTAFAGRQLASAVVRHYWPLSLLAAMTSRSARRWIVLIAGWDAVLGWPPHRRQVPLARFILFRRLDDLCYGAGLWWGVARSRRLQALRPKIGPV